VSGSSEIDAELLQWLKAAYSSFKPSAGAIRRPGSDS
jgi:hypothetical protein